MIDRMMNCLKIHVAQVRQKCLDRTIMSRSRLNVKAADDKSGPWITGCTVMLNGHIVLCDRYNDKIKLLDDSYAITGQLGMWPLYDVSVIDSSNVIVSLPDTMQLRHVQVFPRMRTGRLIQSG